MPTAAATLTSGTDINLWYAAGAMLAVILCVCVGFVCYERKYAVDLARVDPIEQRDSRLVIIPE